MTFSIAGRCSRTGMLGMAITSSSICVASRCCWARARVGAVLTQNLTDPAIGQRGLDLLSEGLSAARTVRRVVEENQFPAYRQIPPTCLQAATLGRAARSPMRSAALRKKR